MMTTKKALAILGSVLALGIVIFFIAGNSKGLGATLVELKAGTCNSYQFVTKWGTRGARNGEFDWPYGIATDKVGNVYVTEINNHRIQKFTSSGQYITQWGKYGIGNGELNTPMGISIDSQGNVYVADTNNHRIQKFSSTGNYISQWGGSGTGNGQFHAPLGIAFDTQGNIYVTDIGLNTVQKFDQNANFVTKWGVAGSGNGEFDQPNSITVDSVGNVYVADMGNHRIQKFTSNGQYISQWGRYGTGNGEFAHPGGITSDSQNNIYVAENSYSRIQKFTSTGQYLTQWGSDGTNSGQFYSLRGIAVDILGNIYVADSGNFRIQKFSPNCKIAPAIQIAPISTTLPIATKDYCPNIDGIQPSIPEGYMVDASGNCVRKLITPTTLQNTSLLTASSTTNIATILPDIIVSDFTWKPFTSNPGNYLYLSVTIKNIGTGSAFFPEGTTFTVYKDTITSGNWSGALTIGNGTFTLAPGETKTLDIITMQNSVLTAQRGMFNIIVKADDNSSWLNLVPGAGVAESNENNNSVTKQITIQ